GPRRSRCSPVRPRWQRRRPSPRTACRDPRRGGPPPGGGPRAPSGPAGPGPGIYCRPVGGGSRAEQGRVAFVLGGGGILGATQVGMLRALFEAGVRPDLVVGTSVGALNGAL